MFTKSNVVSSIERAVTDKVIAPYLTHTDKLNDEFLINRLSPFSAHIKGLILYKGYAHKTVIERNTFIRLSTDSLFALLPEKLVHLFFTGDDDIQLLAKQCADECRHIIIDPISEMLVTLTDMKDRKDSYQAKSSGLDRNAIPKLSESERSAIPKCSEPERNAIPKLSELDRKVIPELSELDRGAIAKLSEPDRNAIAKTPIVENLNSLDFATQQRNFTYERACRYVTTFKIAPPIPTNRIKISGCFKRMADNRWWLRRIRKLITQANEKAAILLNLVNRKKQIYASNVTTKNRQAQLVRNEQLLSSHFIINDAGQRYSLKEISDLNVSNPKVRKAELINRARGFEDLSESLGHKGVFITITCPSKFHRAYSKSGAANPKWDGSMPNDAQYYLNKLWARVRAELKRKNINPYGFRVVEPQHDGTPHWHSLLFVKAEHVKTLSDIIRYYALQEDGDEKGAQDNRCDFKLIDPAKGSATGYILKYIVKNIDGEGLGEDKFGNDAITTAIRINAWASCWCIRQFQQIGGASVSVWRELRRLKDKFFPESLIEKARIAADTSDWQGYIEAMGGIESTPKSHPIKLHYNMNINTNTGECSQSYYDGELVTKIKGLLFEGKAVITRKLSWRLERVA